ncbi:hypothetical protein BDQ12DRAFT_670584 [Crucibulum laeve]|uniref:Uncharacterized protein n=1 Tax=Crucibulum laeve TaxID=68775 RepID=A0A5C3LW83_9AGAR|nr:hypothetical protein BDQ12DRAFT_670584 [Crucibulum laeve]
MWDVALNATARVNTLMVCHEYMSIDIYRIPSAVDLFWAAKVREQTRANSPPWATHNGNAGAIARLEELPSRTSLLCLLRADGIQARDASLAASCNGQQRWSAEMAIAGSWIDVDGRCAVDAEGLLGDTLEMVTVRLIVAGSSNEVEAVAKQEPTTHKRKIKGHLP